MKDANSQMDFDLSLAVEKNMENHPFKDILVPELTRFKANINYEDLKLRTSEENKRFISK